MDWGIFCILGLSIGATFFIYFANYFLKDLIKEKFLNKFKILKLNLKNQNFFIY